ncbi:integrase catalytic domain-containing protein [Haliangium ochraceum]|uniref:Integrase catalytic region n=1 Tax=Haliangium ochraceum (strain DSM 14365 / JCM 11303 / SMP-2) TaxID=502025 RepID=D0LLF1_HALO1|nr:DDE-type integrase/transposase/recombinase [Haliangium ochraceum]ACY18647.1 Integrase catalytic region [Haliangium ochraceum DSM 14365]
MSRDSPQSPSAYISAECEVIGAAGDATAQLSRARRAGFLLASRPYLASAGFDAPASRAILEATGADARRAYDECTRIARVVARRELSSESALAELSRCALRFLMEHPGAVRSNVQRRSYSDEFRKFILALRDEHGAIPLTVFSRAVEVPLPTLREWMRGVPGLELAANARASVPTPRAMAALLDDAELPAPSACERFGAHPVRASSPPPSPGRSRARELHRRYRRARADALRNTFLTFFPGAQWVSDGTPLSVVVNGERHQFNLQLTVDTHSGALVGLSVRDHEDSRGVIAAFRDAVVTTGAPPLALLLDNRPCNRAAAIADALGSTELMYASKGRPQNKAHVEGAFGLFTRQVPPLCIDAQDTRSLARQFLELAATTWARTLNHRARRDRAERSRIELYRAHARNAEQHSAAAQRVRAYLEERRQRAGQRARASRRWQAWLSKQLARIDLGDRDCRLMRSVGRYPRAAIVDGVSTYAGKRAAGTLPRFPDEDAAKRYLLSLVRNIAEEAEGMHIAAALWRGRKHVVADHLEDLERRHATLLRETAPVRLVARLVDESMSIDCELERNFWLEAAARAIRQAAYSRPEALSEIYHTSARRILHTRRVKYRGRLAAMRSLAARLLPLS